MGRRKLTKGAKRRHLRLCAAGRLGSHANPAQVNMRESIPAVVRPPGPVGEVGAGVQGGRVLGAEHPLEEGHQRGELVAGPAA
jgi:hypothetical protein